MVQHFNLINEQKIFYIFLAQWYISLLSSATVPSNHYNDTVRLIDTVPYLVLQGDADIFFPTDFWLLERIDHYSSGWMKLQKDKSSKAGKKRRMITVISSCVDIVRSRSVFSKRIAFKG